MPSIVSHKCINGCVFLKNADDPMICKCAAEATGKRPPASDGEQRLDAMASEASMLESGVLRIAMERLNARQGVVQRA